MRLAQDLARVETSSIFAEQKEDLGEAFLESKCRGDDPDRAPQLARGILEIAKLCIGNDYAGVS